MTDEKKKKPKRRRRAKRGKGKSSKIKQYFNEDTQLAIEEFQSTESTEEKHKIYDARIRPAFEKLAENLIFIYKFTALHQGYEGLKNDCVSFMYETLYKFDASRGTKAFSYFNVVAKNFLIIKSKQRAKFNSRNVSFDNPSTFTPRESMSFHFDTTIDNFESPTEIRQRTEGIFSLLDAIKEKTKSDNEKSCIQAIITLFENIDELEFLNKRAVFVYLREMSGLNPKQLTTTMSSIKKKFRELRDDDEFYAIFGK
tara:strand:- start:253 stop:1017 length:765 start_codon:yes stop_codon:yes gene_type:complete